MSVSNREEMSWFYLDSKIRLNVCSEAWRCNHVLAVSQDAHNFKFLIKKLENMFRLTNAIIVLASVFGSDAFVVSKAGAR